MTLELMAQLAPAVLGAFALLGRLVLALERLAEAAMGARQELREVHDAVTRSGVALATSDAG